jgi:hypothetical protein
VRCRDSRERSATENANSGQRLVGRAGGGGRGDLAAVATQSSSRLLTHPSAVRPSGRLGSVSDSIDSDLRAVSFVLLCSPSLTHPSLASFHPFPFSSPSPPPGRRDACGVQHQDDRGSGQVEILPHGARHRHPRQDRSVTGGGIAEGTRWQRDALVGRARPTAASQSISESVGQSMSVSSFTVRLHLSLLPTRPRPYCRLCPRCSEEKNKRPADSRANINKALDKEHEKKSLTAVLKEPVSALQGQRHSHRDTHTLGSPAIGCVLGAHSELRKWVRWRCCGCTDRVAQPATHFALLVPPLPLRRRPFALSSGLAEWADNTLKPLGAGKIQSLADWKFCAWAEAFTQLAQFETADGSSA